MALVDIINLEKAFTGRSVLKGLSLDLQKGQKIGLVGPNGCGKTTLLKILAGVEHADHGSVIIAKTCKVAYVSQIPRLDPEETLHHQVSLVFDELHAIERQMHEAADVMAQSQGPEHDAAVERYSRLETQHNHMGGYDYQHRVESVLDQLGFATRDLDLPIKALSGGQKSRAQIARLLLEAPDLMLLDEPTNHLDLAMLDWLEETLNAMTDTTLVVVSHDRYFLDSVVNEIFELGGLAGSGKMAEFPGNYSSYVDLREERMLTQERAYDQQQAYIAKQEEYIRRFGANQRAMQARGRKTRLERLKRESLIGKVRRNSKSVVLNLQVKKPSGIDALKTEGLSKSYPDKTLFKDVEILLNRGKRLGIIGSNGSGKTTLLNVLAGDLPADAGTIKWGHGVVRQFYRQEHEDLNPANSVIDELQSVRITASQQELRDLAALFLFSGDLIDKKNAVLSGGERSRVAMGKMLLDPANTILMDEPTNHLDMQTAEVLEEALDTYDGTLILVSHDRFFLDQVCDQLLVLQGKGPSGEAGAWRLYQGSYTNYLATVAAEKAAALVDKRETEKAERRAEVVRQEQAKQREKAAREKANAGKPKIPFKFAKMSMEEIEHKIMNLEGEVADLEAAFGNPNVAANPAALKELERKYAVKKREVAELTSVWEMKGEAAG